MFGKEGRILIERRNFVFSLGGMRNCVAVDQTGLA